MARVRDPWFQTYWRLRAWLAEASSLGNTGDGLAQALLSGSHFGNAVEGFRASAGALKPSLMVPQEFVGRGAQFVEKLAKSRRAFPNMENVYQAAVYAMTRWGWNGNHFHDRVVFRGEAATQWSKQSFSASIYRADTDETILAARIRRLEVAVQWFRKAFPERRDDDLEVIAILQHYALPTWLLDVTTSVYAALYFASGEPKGTGVVYMYSMEEMNTYHQMAPELVPPVKQIRPQFVPRIDRQYGAFLDGGDGWAVRHMVRTELCFEQVEGMQFEDPGLGITKAGLLANEGMWGWFENELKLRLNSIQNPSTPQPGILDLSEYEAAWREDFNDAPRLGIGPRTPPEWPPTRTAFAACAERVLANRAELNADRRRIAADAIALYHRSLTAAPECRPTVSSLHSYVDAVEHLGRELASTETGQYQVADLWRCYEGRGECIDDNLLLVGTLRMLNDSLPTAI